MLKYKGEYYKVDIKMAVVYSKYFPVLEYYEKIVMPINRKFHIAKGRMVCPLHNDHDPSLGIIYKKDGSELMHCFGCNYVADIIKFHQSISKKYFNKYLTPEESLKELCSIFNVDFEKIPKDQASLIENKDMRQEYELVKATEDFDIGDFKYMITKGKREKKGIPYFNTLLMIMVSQYKE